MKLITLFLMLFGLSSSAFANPVWLTEERQDNIEDIAFSLAFDELGIGDDGENCDISLNNDIEILQEKGDSQYPRPDNILISFSAYNLRWPFPGCAEVVKCHAVLDLTDAVNWHDRLVWGSCRED